MSEVDNKLLFSPINKAHAIVEVIMYVRFISDFDDKAIKQFLELEYELKEDLPKCTHMQRYETTVHIEQGDAQNPPVAEKKVSVGGIELESIKKDGSKEWMLRIARNTVAVHCFDYSTWPNIWAAGKRFLTKSLEKIDIVNNVVSATGLIYRDRFLYEGIEEHYDPANLFDTDTDMIFKHAFSAGMRWHCHTGWFDPISATNNTCLNQLNIDAAYGNIEKKQKHITTIEHNIVIHFPELVQGELTSLTGNSSSEYSELDDIFTQLHSKNKEMLKKLLTRKMADRISL